MVRRGSSRTARSVLLALAATLVGVVVAGCDGDDDAGGPPTSAEPVPATLPDDVEVGAGRLVLDGRAYALQVRSCSLQPVTDPATGVTTDLSIDADDGLGVSVSVTRSTVEGDLRTITDTISVADPDGGLTESQRIDRSGTYLDLRADGAIQPLLEIDGELVSAEGVFGPVGSVAGDPGLVEGGVVLRCPPAG